MFVKGFVPTLDIKGEGRKVEGLPSSIFEVKHDIGE